MLFGLYNMSLYGQYITILPPIHLSLTISPEVAIGLRHPDELTQVGRDFFFRLHPVTLGTDNFLHIAMMLVQVSIYNLWSKQGKEG